MASRRLPQDLEPLRVQQDWRPWPRELDPRARGLPQPSGATLPVSVVIPAFDRQELIRRSLASVFAQRSVAPAEVIVVDDGSTDDTAAEASRLGARVIRLQGNQGAASARNAGVEAATQPWIALLDSDDEWLPHLLATLWPLRDDHLLVTGSSLLLDDDGSVQRLGGVPTRQPVILRSPAALVFPQNFVAASGVLLRRDAILAVGGYRTDLRYAEDFDLWLRILGQGTGIASPTAVSLYHVHGGQKSRHTRDARAAQRRALASQADAAWWSRDLTDRRYAVDTWDDLRAFASERRLVKAAGRAGVLLRRPLRLRAVASVARWRHAQRRRSGAIASDGGPTIGLLPGAAPDIGGNRPVVDLRNAHWPRIVAVLARRPPGIVASGSRTAAALARRFGSDSMAAAEVGEPTAAVRMALLPSPETPPHAYIARLTSALADHEVEVVNPADVPAPDVVHVHWFEYMVRSDRSGVEGVARSVVRTARYALLLLRFRRMGTAIVWTVHNLAPHERAYPRLEDRAMRATARLADAIIVHSEYARSRVVETFGHAAKVHVVPLGNFLGYYPHPRRSREAVRDELGLAARTFAFLAFGQIRRYKRLPETVAAFRRLPGSNVALIVAGLAVDADEGAAIEEAAREDPRIVLRLGLVPDDEVTELHAAADAAVVGYREVFSSAALLLALSLGLPVVAPAEGSALEIATPPAVEPFEAGQLADALEAVQTGDPQARREAALAAARKADWDAIAQRTAAIYREAINARQDQR
jgi:beta-1,4-mannosyltransferase